MPELLDNPNQLALVDEPMVEDPTEEVLEVEVEKELPAPSTRPAFDPEIPRDPEERDIVARNLTELCDSYRDDSVTAEQRNIWDACYRAYRGWKPEQQGQYLFVYVIREIFRQLETLKPQMWDQFFSQTDLFEYVPEFPGDEKRVEASTEAVRKQIRYMQINLQMQKWLDMTLQYGSADLFGYWKSFVMPKRKISPMYDWDRNESWWERETKDLRREGPFLEAIPPWRVFSHPNCENIRESPLVGILDIVTPSTLKTYTRQGWLNAEAVKAASEESGCASQEDETQMYLQSMPYYKTYKNMDEPQQIHTYFTNDGWEWAVLNRKTLVRGRRADFGHAPIIRNKNYPQVDEAWGLPEALQLLDDQNLLNDLMSNFVTGATLASMPMQKVKKTAVNDYRNMVYRPGGYVALDNLGDCEPLQQASTLFQLPGVASFVQNNMRVATGIGNELSGIAGKSGTATEHVSRKDAQSSRMRYKVIYMAPQFEDAYAMIHSLNALYLDDEVAVALVGPDGKNAFKYVTPADFGAPVSVRVRLANMMDLGTDAAMKWMNVLARCGQDPMIQRKKLYQRMFKAMGEPRPEDFLNEVGLPQADAVRENQELAAFGTTNDPMPQEDHQTHYAIHTMMIQSEPFKAWPEMKQAATFKHNSIHQEYLAQQQQQMAKAQQASNQMEIGVGGGSPVPATDLQTEAMFDNGANGAASQGGVMGE
jgi:hypothetical protein